jgi:hypothetical protein
LSARQLALPYWRYSWRILYKVGEDILVVNILAGILAEGILEGILADCILAECMVAGGKRMKNCDFVNSSLGRLELTLDKTKRHPWAMEHYMGD